MDRERICIPILSKITAHALTSYVALTIGLSGTSLDKKRLLWKKASSNLVYRMIMHAVLA